jgi:hypothetical protein
MDEAARFTDQFQTLDKITRCLEGAGFAYMITGSVGVSLQAEARTSNDIVDVIVDVKPATAGDLIHALSSDFDVDPVMVNDEVRRGSMFNIFDRSNVFKVDIVPLRHDDLSTTQFSRRLPIRRGESTYWVATPEDLAISKLAWVKREPLRYANEGRAEHRGDDRDPGHCLS